MNEKSNTHFPQPTHFLVKHPESWYILGSPKPLMGNFVKHILILLSFLLLSSPLFGQSEKPQTIIIPTGSLGKISEGVEHPAPFPEKIVILPVLQTTNEGDLVLDPFCGSMTTGKVSQRFNRQFVGYDVQVY